MRFGPDDADDFDLASIPSSDLPVVKMHMLQAVVAFTSTASPTRARSSQPELTHGTTGEVRRRSLKGLPR